ncbi:hypothetical protein GEOBRER4_n1024 [Citrifermentans bremense]|uniref:Uncharacterized protein n=1 Tax=Citrifermentans bremense TaxID=60035 RepID=A0A7R7FRZ3_9BACT|nr:hypothetical protein GEOBRER4_n1024 [Citrifermentans bremense]
MLVKLLCFHGLSFNCDYFNFNEVRHRFKVAAALDTSYQQEEYQSSVYIYKLSEGKRKMVF